MIAPVSKGPFYLSTSIFYANAGPHLGSAMEIVSADAFARFKRLQGYDVFFLTGTDEHGQKIAKKAAELGLEPKALVDRNVEAFKAQFAALNVEYSRFYRTTEEAHRLKVVEVLGMLREKGDLYPGTYEGWYCVPCETFWPGSQLKDGACPTCARPVEKDQEKVWFFRQSKYGPDLIKKFTEEPGWIHPEGRGREMLNNFLKPGLEDFVVSRSRAKVSWGIPFPGDPGCVVYVWFEALINYLGGSPTWPADLHVVGKDILRFHTTTWPAMLLSAGLPLPRRFFAHGWVLAGSGDKMSKSVGNVIDPQALMTFYQQRGISPELAGDVLRYALLREAPLAQDFVLTPEIVEGRYNRDLANDLGNLHYRTLSMIEKYCDGRMPAEGEAPQNPVGATQTAWDQHGMDYLRETLEKPCESFQFNQTLEIIWGSVRHANQLIDSTKPWVLAKNPSQRRNLEWVLGRLIRTLTEVSVLAWPMIPKTCEAIRRSLSLPTTPDASNWNMIPKEGTPFTKGAPLFPRLEARSS